MVSGKEKNKPKGSLSEKKKKRSRGDRNFIVGDDGTVVKADGLVVKADGLAAGKGVFVAPTLIEAHTAIDLIMEAKAYGPSGDRILISEMLKGPEVSCHAFVDQSGVALLPFSCDHKRIGDGDTGPNTGGMGAYSPSSELTDDSAMSVLEEIVNPLVTGLRNRQIQYRGLLYPGLMITAQGAKVLEVNCRFGDPETQVLIPRMESDLLDVLWAVAHDDLANVTIRWNDQYCVGVVMASGGYPEEYETGFEISGLDKLDPDVLTFHAGTKMTADGRVVTSGGRVLTVVAFGDSLEAAANRAYQNVARINFQHAYYRTDIGRPKADLGSSPTPQVLALT